MTNPVRHTTGSEPLDRVFGGGLVAGSVNVIAGAAGVGRSMLLAQLLRGTRELGASVLYLTTDEPSDVARHRVGAPRDPEHAGALSAFEVHRWEEAAAHIATLRPHVVAIDDLTRLAERPPASSDAADITRLTMTYGRTEGHAMLLLALMLGIARRDPDGWRPVILASYQTVRGMGSGVAAFDNTTCDGVFKLAPHGDNLIEFSALANRHGPRFASVMLKHDRWCFTEHRPALTPWRT